MHKTFILRILAIDPALGRLDYDSLSDQALMEMLIDGMIAEQKAELFQDQRGNFKDICDWSELICSNDRVTEIRIDRSTFNKKQFPFEFIPALVTNFFMMGCNLHGTLDFSTLQQNFIQLFVSFNKLHGTLNFKAVPRALVTLSIDSNEFIGSCVLDELPDSLEFLDASCNKLSGEISFNSLPRSMEELHLSNNLLTGPISIAHLPLSMRILGLDHNAFSGEFRLLALPDDLKGIFIRGSNLSGTAIISEAYGEMPFKLVHNSIKEVFDDKGEKHAWEEAIVNKMYEESEDDCDSSDEESADYDDDE